ncbi:hypothetical protein AC1031_009459 [Aphanomyces cochlioides]|nr:hypothetical protein AC1031_009459 [Aphanomyces cochlioides]
MVKNAYELKILDSSVEFVSLDEPVHSSVVGGATHVSTHKVAVSVLIQTAAGPVQVNRPVECLIIDGDENEFLLGNALLKHLGIDFNNLLEQFAASSASPDGGDDINADDSPTSNYGNALLERSIGEMVDEAVKNGFPHDKKQQLFDCINGRNCWRVSFLNDPPVSVDPLKIELKPGPNHFDASPESTTNMNKIS